ncbi:MAG TPA: hypothetical protein VF761_15265 [Gemmatimonadaceae bacterium]
MFARRGLFRSLVLLCAALQLALPGVAALADGLASRTSVHATAHIESGTERDCVRVHETDCVFCQFLSTSASPACTRPIAQFAAVVSGAPQLDAGAPRVAELSRPGDPRGPPSIGSI